MTRRSVKRVDYHRLKTITIGSSDEESGGDESSTGDGDCPSDDDFIEVTPPVKKKKKTTTKSKQDQQDKINSNNNNSSNKNNNSSENTKNDTTNNVKTNSKKKQTTIDETRSTKRLSKTDGSRSTNNNNNNTTTSSVNNDEDLIFAGPGPTGTRRKSRNSRNTGHCFEQDLLTAIEISQYDLGAGGSGGDSALTSSTTNKELSVLCDEEEAEATINVTTTTSTTTTVSVERTDELSAVDSSAEVYQDEDEDDDFAPGVAKKKSKKADKKLNKAEDKSQLCEDTSLDSFKENSNTSVFPRVKTSKETGLDETSQQKINTAKKAENVKSVKKTNTPLTPKVLQDSLSTNVEAKRTPDIYNNNNNNNICRKEEHVTPTLTTCHSGKGTPNSTPGRLRLGLSRNVRVAKPLHSNVTIS